MENSQFISEINKEFYKMQIESIAQSLLTIVDTILEDWNTGIRGITISTHIGPGSIPTFTVSKEYLPKPIKKEEE